MHRDVYHFILVFPKKNLIHIISAVLLTNVAPKTIVKTQLTHNI